MYRYLNGLNLVLRSHTPAIEHYCRIYFKIMLEFLNIRSRMSKSINFAALINLMKICYLHLILI